MMQVGALLNASIRSGAGFGTLVMAVVTLMQAGPLYQFGAFRRALTARRLQHGLLSHSAPAQHLQPVPWRGQVTPEPIFQYLIFRNRRRSALGCWTASKPRARFTEPQQYQHDMRWLRSPARRLRVQCRKLSGARRPRHLNRKYILRLYFYGEPSFARALIGCSLPGDFCCGASNKADTHAGRAAQGKPGGWLRRGPGRFISAAVRCQPGSDVDLGS